MKRRVFTKIKMKERDGFPLVDWEKSDWKVIDEPKVLHLKGGGGSQTTVQKAEPPKFVQPYLEDAAKQATDIFQNNVPQFYPSSTVVDFSPETNTALDMITNRATQGSPINTAAGQQLTNTLSNNYLEAGNPALQGAIDQASEGLVRNFNKIITPGLDANFAGAGRYGSGIHRDVKQDAAEMTGDQLRKIATDMTYQNFGDERQRQIASLALAPQIANQDYTDASQLASVGATREGLSQAQLQEAIDRFNFDTNIEGVNLDEYIKRLATLGGFGGTVTGTNTGNATGGFGGSILGGLGGAATGAGLASTLGLAATGPAGLGLTILGGLGGLI